MINYRFEYKAKGFIRLLEPFFKLFKRSIIKQEQKELETFRDYKTKNKIVPLLLQYPTRDLQS